MSKNEKGRYVKAVIPKDNKKGINDETINRHYQPKKKSNVEYKIRPASDLRESMGECPSLDI